ncbi:hypothetical protein Vretimale_1600 [Volvox reticuliferus]|uniref:Uncharacterized protein n=1 Tax=Volvox reticuliferus TaxID=1737510 RepID=A0A8J4D8C9_9CHLO|nr:hypothetical protein Vretimale_1600 [Volvox reticuliferus]
MKLSYLFKRKFLTSSEHSAPAARAINLVVDRVHSLQGMPAAAAVWVTKGCPADGATRTACDVAARWMVGSSYLIASCVTLGSYGHEPAQRLQTPAVQWLAVCGRESVDRAPF